MSPSSHEKFKDEELIERIVLADQLAFDELVSRYSTKYYAVAFRLIFNKDDAEDIVQDAFIKFWKNPKLWQKDKKTKFTTWFYKVVTNLCIDHQRKKKAEQLDNEFDVEDESPSSEEKLDQKLKQKELKKVILELPERQQAALNLCYYQGLSNKEAAEILDVNLKALESLLSRARRTLKEKLSKSLAGGDHE